MLGMNVIIEIVVTFLKLNKPKITSALLLPQIQHLFFLSSDISSLLALSYAKVSIIIPLTILLNSSSKKIKQMRSVVKRIGYNCSTDPPILPDTQRSKIQSIIVSQLPPLFLEAAISRAQVSQKIRQKMYTKIAPSKPTEKSDFKLKVIALNTFSRL